MWHLICLSSAPVSCLHVPDASYNGVESMVKSTAPTGKHKQYKSRESPPISLRCPLPHLLSFEQPFAGPVLFDFVPPSEPDQEPTRHVLDGPEVEGQKDNDRYEQLHERVREEEGEDQVHH